MGLNPGRGSAARRLADVANIAAIAAVALGLAACAGLPGSRGGRGGGDAVDPWAVASPLGALQVALLHHQLAGTPAPAELALAWPDLCEVRGVEARAEAVHGAAARLAVEAERVAAAPGWQVQVRQPLGPWDPKGGGFRTVLKAGAVIRFDAFNYCFLERRYLLVFRDGDAQALLPVDEAAARALLRRDPSRTLALDLEVEPVAAQLVDGVPALVVDIRRLRATDGSGAVVLDTGAAR
jgi:hypothetical protein